LAWQIEEKVLLLQHIVPRAAERFKIEIAKIIEGGVIYPTKFLMQIKPHFAGKNFHQDLTFLKVKRET
jgi:hypothetical protein